MFVSELITSMIMGSGVAFLSLCLLATSAVLYLRNKRATLRLHGAPKWLQTSSDAVSECEKGGVESIGLLEVCEQTWGSEATQVLPLSVTHYARGLEVRTTYEKGCVKEDILVDTSEKESESVVVEDFMSITDEDEFPVDPVALKHAFSFTPPGPKPGSEQLFPHPFNDPSLENFDFDAFLKDPESEETPLSRPSAPVPRRPSLPLKRKSKRSWDVSDSVDVNFGSMQVKGIREVREDRPRQG